MARNDDGFRDFVLDQLRDLRGVTCRAMFGGYGLSHRKKFFGIIHESRLYFKVGTDTIEDYTALGMKPFRVSSKLTLRAYYEVPPDVLEDSEAIIQWAKRSAGVSSRVTLKKRGVPRGFVLAFCVLLPLVVRTAWGTDNANLPLLWRDVSPQTAQGQPLPAKKPWVIREREIAFDPQLLALLKNAAARPHPPIAIDLFQGRTYELDVTSTVSRLSDLSSVRGTLKNTTKTTWALVISGSVVNGSLQVGERLYKVEHVFNGRHRLLEVDPLKMPAD